MTFFLITLEHNTNTITIQMKVMVRVITLFSHFRKANGKVFYFAVSISASLAVLIMKNNTETRTPYFIFFFFLLSFIISTRDKIRLKAVGSMKSKSSIRDRVDLTPGDAAGGAVVAGSKLQ